MTFLHTHAHSNTFEFDIIHPCVFSKAHDIDLPQFCRTENRSKVDTCIIQPHALYRKGCLDWRS